MQEVGGSQDEMKNMTSDLCNGLLLVTFFQRSQYGKAENSSGLQWTKQTILPQACDQDQQ